MFLFQEQQVLHTQLQLLLLPIMGIKKENVNDSFEKLTN